MLVLTRKPQETIVIDDVIKIQVLGVSGKQVKIGIEAPRDINVNREEIQEKIEAARDETETDNAA